jgi:Xaa-Pro aminopeptidase
LVRAGENAAILTAPDAIAWLLNIRGADVPFFPVPLAFALIHSDARIELFVQPEKLNNGLQHHLGHDVVVSPVDCLGAALDRLGVRRETVRFDPDATPQWIASRLRKNGAVSVYGPDPCALPKAAKNPVEVAGVRAAHVRDGVALTRFLAWLAQNAPGGQVSEMRAADQLADYRSDGALYRGPSFPTISAAGDHAAIVHYRARCETNRPIVPGSLYLVDSGAQYLDGTTDVTRTIAIGQPTDEMRDRFTLVLKGHIALARAVFPSSTTGSQIDAVARLPLWRSGLDYDHGTGHGVGSYLSVHEGPQRLSKLPNRIALQPGMILSNEPGFYRPGHYGIRIENLVLVVPASAPPLAEVELLGFETLTLAPIDRSLIREEMLGDDESMWLNNYHAKVLACLVPLLDPAIADWLTSAAAPIA